MERSEGMQDFIDNFAKLGFGRSLIDSQDKSICVKCGESVFDFTNEVSRREYNIYGFCQNCQDEVFGVD